MAGETQHPDKTSRREEIVKWKAIVAEYQKPNFWRASWQILNTIGGYTSLWCLMYLSLSLSWWLTIPLSVFAGGFLIRIFIIFHDCGHGAFFRSRLANDIWGVPCQTFLDTFGVEIKVWFCDVEGNPRRSTDHEPTEDRLT